MFHDQTSAIVYPPPFDMAALMRITVMLKINIEVYIDLNLDLESLESHYRVSFGRGIRFWGSQDVIRGSRPS